MKEQWCKLTDKDGYTRRGEENQCLWGNGVTHAAKGRGLRLCTEDFIHVYRHPLIAAFMSLIHSDYKNPQLWSCEVSGDCAHEGQLKSGFKTVTTLGVIALPVITAEQRVEIAILCAMTQPQTDAWVKWANAWLDGSDRSKEAAAWAADLITAPARSAPKEIIPSA